MLKKYPRRASICLNFFQQNLGKSKKMKKNAKKFVDINIFFEKVISINCCKNAISQMHETCAYFSEFFFSIF